MNLSSYIKLSCFLMTISAFIVDFELGIIYSLFLLSVLLFDWLLVGKDKIYHVTFFLIVFTVIIAYLLRPFLLYSDGSYFPYTKIVNISVTHELLSKISWKILFNILIFFMSYYFFVLFFSKNLIQKSQKYSHEQISSYYKKEILLFEKKMDYILNLMLMLSILRFLLNVVLSIGIKGEVITSGLSFLARFAPEEFVLAILMTLIIQFRKKLSHRNKIKLWLSIFLLLIAFLSTGSKAVALLLLFFSLVYYMYIGKTFKPIKIFFSVLAVLILIPMSFFVGNAVKFASYQGDLNISNVYEITLQLVQNSNFESIYHDVTNRFIGFDGYIAHTYIKNNLLYEIFYLPNALLRSVGMLIPYVDSGLMTSGVGVSLYISGLPDTAVNAGAVGGFAGFELMTLGIPYVGIIIFSGVIVFSCNMIVKSLTTIAKFFYFFFLAYFIFTALMSGNLDFCFSIWILKIILYKIYFYTVYN